MRQRVVGGALCASLVLAGCAAQTPEERPEAAEPSSSVAPVIEGETIEIADNSGIKTVPFAPERVAAADDRALELLQALGIDASLIDATGDPQLIVVSAGALPEEHGDAAVVDLTPRPDPPLDWEMVRQVQILGQIFGKEAEAAALDDEFSRALERARPYADDSWTVAGVAAADDGGLALQPETGDELWQPVIEMLGLKPALKPGSAGVSGEEAVAALAGAKPDTIVATDRDPDYDSPDYVSPTRLLLADPALGEVPAIQNVNIYVAPATAGTTASIITYTLMLNELAEHWSLVR